jgi:hypothetical protein
LKKAADPSSTVAITGSKWSEVNLLKLLMLAMGNIKSNFVELAAQWAKRYRKIMSGNALIYDLLLTVRKRTSPLSPPHGPFKKSLKH